MKVANVIVAHKNPAQLLRLVNQYDGSLFHNFVHIDGRCKLKHYGAVVNHPNVTLLPKRRKVVWSGFGFVQVTLDAMDFILKSKEKYFYFNLMSGMDFPIKPTQSFYEFLFDSYQKSQSEFFEILDLSVWPAHHRFERFHLAEWTIKGRYFTERIINMFIPKRKFYWGKFTPYGRSAWFTATDNFVRFALQFMQENPDYIRFLKTVWGSDELVFTSLIMNSSFRDKLAPDYLRYIDWSEQKVHPKLLTIRDLDNLMASDAYIARKFDETIDNNILLEIESTLKTKEVAVTESRQRPL